MTNCTMLVIYEVVGLFPYTNNCISSSYGIGWYYWLYEGLVEGVYGLIP